MASLEMKKIENIQIAIENSKLQENTLSLFIHKTNIP